MVLFIQNLFFKEFAEDQGVIQRVARNLEYFLKVTHTEKIIRVLYENGAIHDEYNYCHWNGLVWDFCIMVDRYPFLSAKHFCQNQYIRRIHHKIKKGRLRRLMISKTKML